LNLFRLKEAGISAAFRISLNVHALTLFQPAQRYIPLATRDAHYEGWNFYVRARMEDDLFAGVKCVLFFSDLSQIIVHLVFPFATIRASILRRLPAHLITAAAVLLLLTRDDPAFV
jgi:hypothetical protein